MQLERLNEYTEHLLNETLNSKSVSGDKQLALSLVESITEIPDCLKGLNESSVALVLEHTMRRLKPVPLGRLGFTRPTGYMSLKEAIDKRQR